MNKSERWARWRPRLPKIAGAAAALAALVLAAYYILGPSRGYYHSDCADTIFWAQATLDAGALYNTEFNYACLLPFGGQWLMLPFVALWGVSFAAHAAGMLLFLLLFAGALWWFCRTQGFGVGWTGVTVASALGVLCLSDKLREIYLGHIIYYSLGSFFLLVGLTLLYRAEKAPTRAAYTRRSIALVVWFFLCALNGLPSLALFSFPVLVGYYGERFLDTRQKLLQGDNRLSLQLTLMGTLGTIGGLFVGMGLGKNIVAGYEEAFSRFSPTSEWAEHLQSFLPHWLSLLGCGMTGGEKFLSGEGVAGVLRIGVGLALLAAPVIAVFFWKRLRRETRVLLLTHGAVSAFILFAFVFGSLSNANWRLSPMVVTATLTTVALCRELCAGAGKRIGVLCQAAVALLAAFGLLSVAVMPANYGEGKGLRAVADYLEAQGFTYGYATFWNAGAVTVLSDSAVEVRNISVDKGSITPYTYQSNNAWFEDQGAEEHYFLLLSPGEYNDLKSAENGVLSRVTDTQYIGSYIVLTLPGSLFT